MDNRSNMLQLCRLCLVKDDVNIPIFEEHGDIRQIFLKITSCLPVKVSRDDKLPKKICDGCSYKLETLYEFWNTSVNAEKQLLAWLGEAGMNSEMADGTITAVAQQIKPTDTFVKQETVDPPDVHSEDHDQKDYVFQQKFESASAGPSATVTSNEEEEPPPKRARRTAAVKAAIAMDRDSDDDDDSGEPITKVEDESEESDGEDHTFADAPSTSADDQPGPSGVGKDGVDAPFEIQKKDILKSFLECRVVLTKVDKHVKDVECDRKKKCPKYTCLICFENFFTSDEYNRHKLKHGGQEIVSEKSSDPVMSVSVEATENVDDIIACDPIQTVTIVIDDDGDVESSRSACHKQAVFAAFGEPTNDGATYERDDFKEGAEPLFIVSSLDSNDQTDVIPYDFHCDICYDIFCSVEELQSHMKFHSQINDRSEESKNLANHRIDRIIRCEKKGTIKNANRNYSSTHKTVAFNVSHNTVNGFIVPEISLDKITATIRHHSNITNKMVPNKTSKMVSNRTSKMVSNKTSKMVSNKTSKVISNKPSKMVSNKTIKMVSNETNKTISNETSEMVSNDHISSAFKQRVKNPRQYTNKLRISASAIQESTSSIRDDLSSERLAPFPSLTGQNFLDSGRNLHQTHETRNVETSPKISQRQTNIQYICSSDSNEEGYSAPSNPVKNVTSEDTSTNVISGTSCISISRLKYSLNNRLESRHKTKKKQDEILKNPTASISRHQSNSTNKIVSNDIISRNSSLRTKKLTQNKNKPKISASAFRDSASSTQDELSSRRQAPINTSCSVLFSNVSAHSKVQKLPVKCLKKSVTNKRKPKPKSTTPILWTKIIKVDKKVKMPKITGVMSMNCDIMKSESITVLSDGEGEEESTRIKENHDDIENALPVTLIIRPGDKQSGIN